jgi:hypothetical protein
MICLAMRDPNSLPAPLWLITALHVLTLTLHFLAMGSLFGGVLVLLAARLEGGFAHPVARRLVKLLPSLMAATVTLGVAPLLFVQLVYGDVMYSAAIVSGWFWLGIPFAAMFAYGCFHAASSTKKGVPRVRLWVLLGLAALVYISLTYSAVFSLAEFPASQKAHYAANPAGTVWHPELSRWLWRWLHMVTGAFTIGAFFLGVLGRRDDDVRRDASFLFVLGTGATFFTGMLHLFTLGEVVKPFLHSPGMHAVATGIVASIVAVPFFVKRRLVLSGLLLGVGVGSMVYGRHVVRLLRLEGSFDPAKLPVAPQWGVFAIFLVCLLVAVAAVAWMLRVYFGGVREAQAPPA